VTVRDFGRGIPLGKVIECVSQINTGAKYNDEVFQFSVGLNGVGTKAVNALSDTFVVRSHREGQFVEATFKRGRLAGEKKGKTTEPDGTFVRFTPDREIFKEYDLPNGAHRAPDAALRVSQQRLEAVVERAGISVAPRVAGVGDGRGQGGGDLRAALLTPQRRLSSVSPTATAGSGRHSGRLSTVSSPAMAARI
jgi:hypothetical protein